MTDQLIFCYILITYFSDFDTNSDVKLSFFK